MMHSRLPVVAMVCMHTYTLDHYYSHYFIGKVVTVLVITTQQGIVAACWSIIGPSKDSDGIFRAGSIVWHVGTPGTKEHQSIYHFIVIIISITSTAAYFSSAVVIMAVM